MNPGILGPLRLYCLPARLRLISSTTQAQEYSGSYKSTQVRAVLRNAHEQWQLAGGAEEAGVQSLFSLSFVTTASA